MMPEYTRHRCYRYMKEYGGTCRDFLIGRKLNIFIDETDVKAGNAVFNVLQKYNYINVFFLQLRCLGSF